MKIYFNIKSNYGVETVDEICSTAFDSLRSFYKEVRRLRNEYHIAGMNVYTSQRSDKTW